MAKLTTVAVVLLAGLALSSCSNPNEKANKLFVEATILLQQCDALATNDFETAAEKGQVALKRLEAIIKTYPSSEIMQGCPGTSQSWRC